MLCTADAKAPCLPRTEHTSTACSFSCRRKTTEEKKAEAVRKAEASQQPIGPSMPFTLGQRQPWASKVAEVRRTVVDWDGVGGGVETGSERELCKPCKSIKRCAL